MVDPPTSTPDEAPKPVRRRASRPAGPASAETEPAVVTTPATAVSVRPDRPAATWAQSTVTPPRRQPNRTRVVLLAVATAVVLLVVLGGATAFLLAQQRTSISAAERDQRFVDTGAQTVVNMFSYTPDTIDESVNRFMDGISGPLRDMMSQDNNPENLKAIFRDTNATSEAVVNAAALEGMDEIGNNASVLVAVRVTVTDIDGVNKPSQAFRLRIIVHEDDNGRMTGWDLKYPDGGN